MARRVPAKSGASGNAGASSGAGSGGSGGSSGSSASNSGSSGAASSGSGSGSGSGRAKRAAQAGTSAPRAEGPSNRRGSPEAIEKRKAARIFNDVLGGGGAAAHKLDGRTEKRRQRLLRELEQGAARGAKELKPLDVLQRVQELLELGEPLRSIRKVSKVRKVPVADDAVVDVVERLHKAYHFRPEAYRFVGIGDDVLQQAGVLVPEGARGARRRKPKAK